MSKLLDVVHKVLRDLDLCPASLSGPPLLLPSYPPAHTLLSVSSFFLPVASLAVAALEVFSDTESGSSAPPYVLAVPFTFPLLALTVGINCLLKCLCNCEVFRSEVKAVLRLSQSLGIQRHVWLS